eukprot:GHRR01019040.1.p1 GENE.GHRR01019040.1~~GHRR01019040.1.p1  ORF type:complete len:246 (+),score=43.68 GHRR01019040.1:141-878(+)
MTKVQPAVSKLYLIHHCPMQARYSPFQLHLTDSPIVVQILDEAVAAVAVLEAQQWRTSTEKSLEYAQSLAAKAAATLSAAASAAGINDVSTTSCALTPEGGASDVGASVCEYANNCKVGWVGQLLLGSRPLHGWSVATAVTNMLQQNQEGRCLVMLGRHSACHALVATWQLCWLSNRTKVILQVVVEQMLNHTCQMRHMHILQVFPAVEAVTAGTQVQEAWCSVYLVAMGVVALLHSAFRLTYWC